MIKMSKIKKQSMKTIFYETNAEDQQVLSELIKSYPDLRVEFIADKLTAENLRPDAEAISVFVGSEIRQAQIDAMPNLRLITTRSTGYDHIDTSLSKEKNITVCNVPAYGSRTVAEFAFTLILTLSRKLFVAADQIKEGKGFTYQAFEGFDLQSKTLGIIGTGRIGQNVAQIAKGFNMNILGFDVFPNEQKAKELNFKYVNLNELLANSDVITLHVPYSKDTRHLINKNNINKIKKGALVINTARGEVMDTEALLMALQQGRVGGAGLDVLEGERLLKDETTLIAHTDPKHTHLEELRTLIANHALINMPNVIITPHIAFFTKEAKAEILKITTDNIVNFIKNTPLNIV